MALRSVNPATGQTVHEYAEAAEQEVSAVLSEAARAFADWKTTAFDARAAHLRRAGQVLLARQDELARLMALEMGKPLAQGRAEADKCALVCDFYAEQAEQFLAPRSIPTDGSSPSAPPTRPSLRSKIPLNAPHPFRASTISSLKRAMPAVKNWQTRKSL